MFLLVQYWISKPPSCVTHPPHGSHKYSESAGGGDTNPLWNAGHRTVKLQGRGQEGPLAAVSQLVGQSKEEPEHPGSFNMVKKATTLPHSAEQGYPESLL